MTIYITSRRFKVAAALRHALEPLAREGQSLVVVEWHEDQELAAGPDEYWVVLLDERPNWDQLQILMGLPSAVMPAVKQAFDDEVAGI